MKERLASLPLLNPAPFYQISGGKETLLINRGHHNE
jgi:hypothetical protein